MSNKVYKLDGNNALEVLKWLRGQAPRGESWDFAGGYKSANFWFKDQRLELAYIMRWEWSKQD